MRNISWLFTIFILFKVIFSPSPWYRQILGEGERRGIISGIEMALEIKFGSEGLQLMPQISQISDLEQLKVIQRGVKTLNNLEELLGLIAPQQKIIDFKKPQRRRERRGRDLEK